VFKRFQERPVSDQIVLALSGVAVFCIMGMMSVIVWELVAEKNVNGLERAFIWLSRIINTIIGFVFGYITAGAVKARDKDDDSS